MFFDLLPDSHFHYIATGRIYYVLVNHQCVVCILHNSEEIQHKRWLLTLIPRVSSTKHQSYYRPCNFYDS